MYVSYKICLFPELKFAPRSGHRIVVDDKYIYCWGGFNPEFWDYASNSEDTRYPLFREVKKFSLFFDILFSL